MVFDTGNSFRIRILPYIEFIPRWRFRAMVILTIGNGPLEKKKTGYDGIFKWLFIEFSYLYKFKPAPRTPVK